MRGKNSLAGLTAAAIAAACATSPALGQFNDVSNWAAFDAGEHGVGNDPDGYWGAVFDGRYVYFVPGHNAGGFHGEVLRYDTMANFEDVTSWTAFDPGDNGAGFRPQGFMGGTFDGRYVYFAPLANDFQNHGEVLRYDTTGSFTATSSWSTYDAGSHGVGDDPDGYHGAVFDGRYVYFVPTDNGTRYHGEVLRYDTTGNFSDVSSWSAYEVALHGVGNNARGYAGGVFDGRYVYFIPLWNSGGANGEVLRYDTSGNFSTNSSWIAFDPGSKGVGEYPVAFVRGIFDGRYVYFVPSHNGNAESSEVLRYDTSLSFTAVTSWAAYDPAVDRVGVDADQFGGAVFDGQYIYFAPHFDDRLGHDEVLRYDTAQSFADSSSWSVYDPVDAGVGTGVDGRYEGVFDGRYVYFAPFGWNPRHGEVLRYDTWPVDPVPAISEWGMIVMTLLIAAAGSVVLVRTRRCRLSA